MSAIPRQMRVPMPLQARYRPGGMTNCPSSALTRAILAFLPATLRVRLIAIFVTGFCDDEAYRRDLPRPGALIFRPPPLHQWVLTAWTGAFGEGWAARLKVLPFDKRRRHVCTVQGPALAANPQRVCALALSPMRERREGL